jgi:hypothetical protein
LQLRDIVASQSWNAVVQQALAKSPPRFDQALPRGLVHDAGDRQPACALERLDDRDRSFAKLFDDVTRRRVTERGELFV